MTTEDYDDEHREPGAASILIELSDGMITVTHGTDDVVLKQWMANTGDWDALWATIDALHAMEA